MSRQKIQGDPPWLMRQMPNWIAWGWFYRGNDKFKMPFDCKTRKAANSSDSSTWCTYAEARAAVMRVRRFEGLGFVFGHGCRMFGIDLDGCIIDGKVADWATKIIKQFPTYAEISPSGGGIKLYGIGEKPSNSRCMRKINSTHPSKDPAIEVYGFGRYFCFTGQQYGNIREVYDCQYSLNKLVDKMTPVKKEKPRRVVDLNSTEEFRIRKAEEMLQRHGPAISKSNGHTHTFRAALALVDGFNLPEDIAFELLLKWNATCQPPWSEEDLHRKLREAMRR